MRWVDTVVISLGPGGLAAAIEVSGRSSAEKVLIVEKRRSTKLRLCPVDFARQCCNCGGTCNLLSGFVGCIHRGYGVKLSFLPSGRSVYDVLGPRADLLMSRARETVEQSLGRSLEFIISPSDDSVDPDVRYKPYPVVVLSTEDVRTILDSILSLATRSPKVGLQISSAVIGIEPGSPHTVTLRNSSGGECEKVRATNVIVAVGRAGLLWWHSALRRHGTHHFQSIPSVGLRFELNHSWLGGAAARHPDYEVTMKSKGRKFESLCYCDGPGDGRIRLNDYGDFCLLDDHVVSTGDVKLTDRTRGNVALLHQETSVPNGVGLLTHMVRKYVEPYRRLCVDRPGKPVAQIYYDFAARSSSVESWADIANQLKHVPSVLGLGAASGITF